MQKPRSSLTGVIASHIVFGSQEPTAVVAASQRDLSEPATQTTPFHEKGRRARVIIILRQIPILPRVRVTTSLSQSPVTGHGFTHIFLVDIIFLLYVQKLIVMKLRTTYSP